MNQYVGRFSDFHAGHFLRQLLQEQGHDVPWLAARTDTDTDALDLLLEQADMDAKLFVSLGLPLQPLFMQRVDEVISAVKLRHDNQND